MDEADSKVVSIGLDGVYRSSGEDDPILARGTWTDPETFVLDYAEGLGLDTYILKMHFKDIDLLLDVNDIPADER